jgi:hypothetical protein
MQGYVTIIGAGPGFSPGHSVGAFPEEFRLGASRKRSEVVRFALWIHCAWRCHILVALWATSVLIPCKHEKGGIMSPRATRFLRLPISLALLIGFASLVHAAGWLDDFNDGNAKDGNPVTWLEDLGGSGFFPGVYDASSGDYLLDPADSSPTGQMSALVPAVSFNDTYMRTQGKVLPDPNDPLNNGGNMVLTARVDPVNLTGYLVYFDVSGNLQLQILAGGDTEDIGTTDYVAPFNASSEVVLELNVVGDQLSAYAWLADDPNGKPAEPQVTATDGTFTSGNAGVAYAEDDLFTSVVYRYVASQDSPFVDALAGDFNGDGKVDAADYVVWRKGAASQTDYDTWRMNFGAPAGSGSLAGAAVPEPGTLIQLLAAVAGLAGLSAGRSRSMLG